jgi:hypothetical protein
MKAIKSLLVAALAAAGMVATAHVEAAGMSHGGGHASGGSHWSGGHWGGRGYFYGPRVGFFIGAPLLFGPWYWGYPYDYYYPYYYPRTVYTDGAPDGYAAPYPEGEMQPAPTTQVAPNAPGAPAQAPAYMNYCESSKAYFPKVTACPEGWKFVPAR